ncbi:MAG: hypothetical protein GEU90_15310 [Gemmatimonas sp.]|nr:hypothetical protein [Gemmatimonas sp.]
MHILLTDILTCPRCGPEFGLVVMADHWDDRLVQAGRLGCANCRESYAIEAGVVDLRHSTVSPLPSGESVGSDPERAFRAAALLGVNDVNATLLVVEPAGEAAGEVARVLQGTHVVGGSAEPNPGFQGGESVLSSILIGEQIPLRDRSVRGIALLGTVSTKLIEEAARLLVRGARLVVDPAPPELSKELREQGFTVHLEQDGVVVATASAHP